MRSSPPNVKKNKDSLCSACFNNFHKFSSEIYKKKSLPLGRKKEEEREGCGLGVREKNNSIEMSGWTWMNCDWVGILRGRWVLNE